MDDETRNRPERTSNGEYTYRPLLPDEPVPMRADAAQNAPFTWPDERDTPPRAVVPPGAPLLLPVAASGAAPTWEWRNGGNDATSDAAPRGWYEPTGDAAPRGWYEPTGEADTRPGNAPMSPTAGGWRQTAVGRWVSRVWPLILLGLSKLKWLAVLFKFKAFTTFGSMLLSLGAYAIFFGWQFAVGFIALLFIHEMGHAFVMRLQGIKTTPVLFIPFMGAVIGMREMPKNAFAEAQMALGGPILGSLGAFASLGLWQVTGSPIFVALAYSGFLLNLFNLIPVSPLDGGRAMAAISPWGWLVGIALMVLLFLRVHSLILGVILIVGVMEVFKRWQSRGDDRAYYETTGRQRLLISVVYFGLAATLALMMFFVQSHLLTNSPVR